MTMVLLGQATSLHTKPHLQPTQPRLMLDGKTKTYALIRDNQKIVKMDAETAKTLYDFYNKYVELAHSTES